MKTVEELAQKLFYDDAAVDPDVDMWDQNGWREKELYREQARGLMKTVEILHFITGSEFR